MQIAMNILKDISFHVLNFGFKHTLSHMHSV